MKKGRSNRKALVIGGLAVVLILATVLALVLTQCSGGQEPETSVPTTVPVTEPETYELYWNLDRAEYDGKSEAGMSGRTLEEDGYFHIRFFKDGELFDYECAVTHFEYGGEETLKYLNK